MSTYTPEMSRAVVDDLDMKIRDAVKTGNVKNVIKQERSAISSLMKMVRESRNYPDIQRELDVPRFLWVLLPAWQALKHESKVTDKFWTDQVSELKNFDKKHPNHFRQASVVPEELAPPVQLPVPEENVPPVQRSPSPTYHYSPRRITPALPQPRITPALPQPRRITPALPQPGSSKPALTKPASSKPAVVQALKPALKKPAPSKPAVVEPDQASIKVRHQRPVETKGKGKEKMVEESEEEYIEEEDEEDEDSPAPDPAPSRKRKAPVPPRQDKGKQKMVSEDDRESSSEDPNRRVAPPASQKRQSPKSNGQVKDRACHRCVKGGRVCYQQAGSGTACVFCARIKMKCDEEDGRKEVRVIVPAPKKPAPSRKPAPPSKNPALSQKPAPRPSVPSKRPAPEEEAGSSKKRRNRRPEPEASSKRRKVVKSPPKVVSSEDSDDSQSSMPVPAAGSKRKVQTQAKVSEDAGDDTEKRIANVEENIQVIDKNIAILGRRTDQDAEFTASLRTRVEHFVALVELVKEQNATMGLMIAALRGQVEDQDKVIRKLQARIAPRAKRARTQDVNDLAPVAGPSGTTREASPPIYIASSPSTLSPLISSPSTPVPVPDSLPVLHAEEPARLATPLGPALLPTPGVQPPPPPPPVVEAIPPAVDDQQLPDIPPPVDDVPPPVDDAPVPMPGIIPSSDMPPPPLPLSQATVDMPTVQLLPPTPNTSQEAANYAPTTLLEVPASTPPLPSPLPSIGSHSPSADPSARRRSPRLASPGPSAKRQATDPLVEPASKKKKGE